MLPVSVLQLEHGHAVASDRENLWHCGVLVLLMAGVDDGTNQCDTAELATMIVLTSLLIVIFSSASSSLV